jgi:hypothetical protein
MGLVARRMTAGLEIDGFRREFGFSEGPISVRMSAPRVQRRNAVSETSNIAPSFRWGGSIPLACAALLLAVAPLAHAREETDAARLKARAQQFWDARVQDQWGTVFDLMPTEEQQVAGDRERFSAYQKEKGWFKYVSAQLGETVVDNDLGWVELTFTTALRLYPTMPPQTVTAWDVWRKTDDWRPIPRATLDQYPTRPPSARPSDDEADLAKRVDGLWKARVAQDWAAVYEFLDPGYRKRVSKEEFLQRKSKYLTLSHRTEWIEVTRTQARSKVVFSQKLNDPTLYKLEPTDEVAFEPWVKVEGQWFRAMEPARGSV